jgi:hypothetical protein
MLAKAEESLHFTWCAAFGKYETRKKDEIDSAFCLLHHVTEDRPQFVELFGSNH